VSLVGKTLRDTNFRTRYGAAVVAISHRSGPVPANKRLGDVVLAPGDTLLLEADANFYKRFGEDNNFALVYPLKGSGAPIDDKFHLFFSLATISCMISVAAAGKYEIWITGIGSAILLTVTGCISVRDATSAIEIPILLTICFAFGVGNAIAQTKLADAFAKLLVKWLKPVGSIGIHFATYILVGLLTEIITNNGACAVMYPIIAAIIKTKQVPGLDPYGIMYTLMLAGSSSIITPIGYQLNLMAHAAGGYRWADWFKYSFPLKILLCITAAAGSNSFYRTTPLNFPPPPPFPPPKASG
jgi:di/tricarboxylate transporter